MRLFCLTLNFILSVLQFLILISLSCSSFSKVFVSSIQHHRVQCSFLKCSFLSFHSFTYPGLRLFAGRSIVSARASSLFSLSMSNLRCGSQGERFFRIGAKQTMTHLSIHFFSWPWSSSMLNLNIYIFFGADPLEKSGHLTKLYLFLFERLFTGVASPQEIELIETLQKHAHACWSFDDVKFYHAPCRVVVRCSHQSDEMMVTVECWEIWESHVVAHLHLLLICPNWIRTLNMQMIYLPHAM